MKNTGCRYYILSIKFGNLFCSPLYRFYGVYALLPRSAGAAPSGVEVMRGEHANVIGTRRPEQDVRDDQKMIVYTTAVVKHKKLIKYP